MKSQKISLPNGVDLFMIRHDDGGTSIVLEMQFIRSTVYLSLEDMCYMGDMMVRFAKTVYIEEQTTPQESS